MNHVASTLLQYILHQVQQQCNYTLPVMHQHATTSIALANNNLTETQYQFLNAIYHPSMQNQSVQKVTTTQEETKEQFEQKKRQLLLMLDQAQMSKMKLARAFGDKLQKLFPNEQDFARYGLNWHPGWREPERHVPDTLDADPFRGACAQSSCPCDLFVTWPVDTTQQVYIYNPKLVNAETDLCYTCHHLKSDHTLHSKTARNSSKEFSADNMQKYAVQYRADIPAQHPADVPLYELQKYYEKFPDAPGATGKVRFMAIPEEEGPKKKGLAAVIEEEQDEFDDDGELA